MADSTDERRHFFKELSSRKLSKLFDIEAFGRYLQRKDVGMRKRKSHHINGHYVGSPLKQPLVDFDIIDKNHLSH